MAHDKASLMKLNKEGLVRIILDYQERLNDVLDDLQEERNLSLKRKELFGQKSVFFKLEADIQVTRNINTEPSKNS